MPASSLRSLARSFRRPLSSPLSAPTAAACPALVRPRFASPVRPAALPLSARRWNSSVPTPPPALAAPEGPQSAAAEGGEASEGIKATWVPAEGQPAGPLRLPKDDPKLALTFTCTAEIVSTETTVEVAEGDVRTCSHRSSHTISKQAYTSGIVLIQCPECENRHLIADHLGWFPEITQGSGEKRVLRTIEDIMQEKGETVRRGIQHGEGGNIEVF